MLLSIIICTYNRSQLLEDVLNDLSTQYQANILDFQHKLEIVLIDNNSTDKTKNTTEAFFNNLPIKYFLETKQGLSFARNRGIKEAVGALIAFMDDDIRLSPDWLSESIKIAEQHKKLKESNNDQYYAYGGKVLPQWSLAEEEKLPRWINFEAPFAVSQSVFPSHDYGDEERDYPFNYRGINVNNPLGANMMFSKEIFKDFGDFRIDLGVNAGGGVGLHEDTEFCRYLQERGIKVKYIPQCSVYHPVPKARMSQDFVRSWYFKSGRSLYWMAHNLRSSKNEYLRNDSKSKEFLFVGIPKTFKKLMPNFMERLELAKVPLYLYCKLIAVFWLWAIMHLSFDSRKVFWFSIQLHKSLGEIEAAKLVANKPKL